MRTTALPPGVTTIGCGDLSLAVAADRGVDAREVERALDHALALGITLVEVRDEPDAERLVGNAIRTARARDRVMVATNVSLVPPRLGVPPRDLLPELLPARYVQERIEAQLRSTRLDALPLAQLPLRVAWRDSTAYAELVGTCARLVGEGKVLAWGARVDEPAQAFATEPWLAAISVVFNLIDRTADPLLAATKLAVLARQPLAGGALTGNLAPGVRLPPRDDRNELSPDELERMAVRAARLSLEVRTDSPAIRSCPAAREVRERGRRPNHVEANTLTELALRFVIDRGAIPLPRIHRHAHVMDAVVAASSPPLSAGLMKRIVDDKA